MLFSASLLALVLPLAAALSITIQPTASSGGSYTISWSGRTSEDPESVAIWLVNSELFNDKFAIANNVDIFEPGSRTINLPQVQADNRYTIEFTRDNDANAVVAQAGPIAISSESSSVPTLSRTSTRSTSSSASSSRSTSSSSSSVTLTSTSTTGLGTTISRTTTPTPSPTATSATTPPPNGAISNSVPVAAALAAGLLGFLI